MWEVAGCCAAGFLPVVAVKSPGGDGSREMRKQRREVRD
jgi:hypothetical protein